MNRVNQQPIRWLTSNVRCGRFNDYPARE